MCQHCDGYDHAENTAALGAALIRRQQEKHDAVAASTAPDTRQRPAGVVRPSERQGQ